MFRPLIIAALLAAPSFGLPASADAQQAAADTRQAETGQPPQRIRSVTLTGADKCPSSTAEEIVVCSRINPDEQFRIPKEVRNDGPIPTKNESWVNRAATVDQVGRSAAGLPDTCSAIGTGGQSGCALARARAYSAEKRAAQAEAATTP